MGFQLKLRFHGSIALVTDRVNNIAHMLIGNFKQAVVPKPLVPYIKFPAGSLSGPRAVGAKEPPKNSLGNPDLRHILIDDELLTLNAKFTGQKLQLIEHDPSDDPSPTPIPSNAFSLTWLPHLQIADDDPATGVIDPELMKLPQPTTPQPRPVVGRIDLTNGVLRTTGILSPELVEFSSSGRDKILTAIAREAELVLDLDDDSFVIESDSMFVGRTQNRAPNGPQDLSFNFNGQPELVITIGNEPEDEIHEPLPQIKSDEQNDAEAIEEFLLLYSMSQKKNIANPRLPRVSGRRPSSSVCVIPRAEKPADG